MNVYFHIMKKHKTYHCIVRGRKLGPFRLESVPRKGETVSVSKDKEEVRRFKVHGVWYVVGKYMTSDSDGFVDIEVKDLMPKTRDGHDVLNGYYGHDRPVLADEFDDE